MHNDNIFFLESCIFWLKFPSLIFFSGRIIWGANANFLPFAILIVVSQGLSYMLVTDSDGAMAVLQRGDKERCIAAAWTLRHCVVFMSPKQWLFGLIVVYDCLSGFGLVLDCISGLGLHHRRIIFLNFFPLFWLLFLSKKSFLLLRFYCCA